MYSLQASDALKAARSTLWPGSESGRKDRVLEGSLRVTVLEACDEMDRELVKVQRARSCDVCACVLE